MAASWSRGFRQGLRMFKNKMATPYSSSCDPISLLRTSESCSSRVTSLSESTTKSSSLDHYFRDSLVRDIQSLQILSEQLSSTKFRSVFTSFAKEILSAAKDKRQIFLSGVGKSGIIAKRLAASLSSVSIPSYWIHGSEFFHGDLGCLRRGDIVILFSHSGETRELVDLVEVLNTKKIKVLSVTGNSSSSVAQKSTYNIVLPAEKDLLECIPSRSILVQESFSNALLTAVTVESRFTKKSFRDNHPGGAIGKLLKE